MQLEQSNQKLWWIGIEPDGGVSQFSRAVTEHELMETWNKLSVALAVIGFSEKAMADGAVDKLLHAPRRQADDLAELTNRLIGRHVTRDQFPKRWRQRSA